MIYFSYLKNTLALSPYPYPRLKAIKLLLSPKSKSFYNWVRLLMGSDPVDKIKIIGVILLLS